MFGSGDILPTLRQCIFIGPGSASTNESSQSVVTFESFPLPAGQYAVYLMTGIVMGAEEDKPVGAQFASEVVVLQNDDINLAFTAAP
jgi:hypothetical protein